MLFHLETFSEPEVKKSVKGRSPSTFNSRGSTSVQLLSLFVVKVSCANKVPFILIKQH